MTHRPNKPFGYVVRVGPTNFCQEWHFTSRRQARVWAKDMLSPMEPRWSIHPATNF